MAEKSPRLIAALAFAAAGIPIFPCVVDGKVPATANGFDDATTDTAQIEAWWAVADYNLALEPERAEWAVIDLDGAEGVEAWSALVRKHGDPGQTYQVRTPRGGTHIYYSGSLPASVQKLGPKIDTRGRRSYVLMPPSVVNGKPYSVIDHAQPAPLPDWVEPLLVSLKPAPAPAVEHIDPADAERRGRSYLEGLVAAGDVAIEGKGGDNRTYAVCCWLRDAGCTPEQSLALLQEIWNPHCIPPWSDEELGVKIEHASLYGQNPEGVSASAPAGETFRDFLNSPEASQSAPRSPLPDPVRLGDIPGSADPVEMMVEKWIQKDKFNIFRGRGGSNKSRLALQWAMMVDAGQGAVGFAVQKATAIYISCEDDKSEVKRRRNSIAKKLDLPDSGVLFFDMTDEEDAFLLYVRDDSGVTKTGKWDDLEARLTAIPGPKMLVLDSTYDVIDFAGATKNSDGHVRTVIRMFDRLCRQTNTTIICLWHPSRAGMGRGDEGGFATAWDNAPRNAISIKPVEGEDDMFELNAEKRNNLAKGRPLILRWIEGILAAITNDDASALMEHEAVIEVALLAANSGQPVAMRTKPATWVFEEIAKRGGRKMSITMIRDHLSSECRRDTTRLSYRHHDPHGRGEPAGWVARFDKPAVAE